MGDITIGLLGALLATNQPVAVSNLVAEHTGMTLPIVDTQDPVERELHGVMELDELALDEVGQWFSTNQIPRTDTNAVAKFDKQIQDRLEVVKNAYDRFLRNHPDHARGYLAYGSFLDDIGQEEAAKIQYENSKHLDPKNPAVWNQLANYFGEHGELTNAFAGYAEAIRLDPSEPVYYHNFATTVYLYCKDAREFYGITEQQVFDKSLALYRQTMQLAPSNLVFAVDYAESYYGIKPLRTNDALVAWTNAYNICRTDVEREGILLHLARTKTYAGLYDEAADTLARVTNSRNADLRIRLEKSLEDHRHPHAEETAPEPIPQPGPTLLPATHAGLTPPASRPDPVPNQLTNSLIVPPPQPISIPPATPAP